MTHHLSLAELKSFDSHARGGREQRFCCPSCGRDKPRDTTHRSLAVNANTGVWLCHRCGEKGLLSEFHTYKASGAAVRLSPRERGRRAAARAFAVPEIVNTRTSVVAASETSVTDAAKIDFAAIWEKSLRLINRRETGAKGKNKGAAYIAGRALDVTQIDDDTVRYSPDFYEREAVLFPVRNRAGELVSVSGRFITSNGKFKTQAAGRTSNGVFATPGALESSIVAVCEAPIDALSLWQCGIPAIALIGCSAPAWLLAALAWRDVLLATDADAAGDTVAAKLTGELEARGGRTLRLRARRAKDWNESLQQRGQDALRANLAAFAPATSDAVREQEAARLWRAGRTVEASFAARLISDLANAVRVQSWLRSGFYAASENFGDFAGEIRIPANLPHTEEAIAACLNSQRQSVGQASAA